MKNKKILEGNKLIAKFMISKNGKVLKTPGMIYQQDELDDIYVKDVLDEEDYASFKYHKSWNWLIPVLKKIDTLTVEFQIDINSKNIESIYEKVVKFIKYYNKQKK
jgi:hypothetical protein